LFSLLYYNQENYYYSRKICYYWPTSISEINIKCKYITRNSNGGAPPVPPHLGLWGGTCPPGPLWTVRACEWLIWVTLKLVNSLYSQLEYSSYSNYRVNSILLTGDILLGDILQAILLPGEIIVWRYFAWRYCWRYIAGDIYSVHHILIYIVQRTLVQYV
jgi:hypothetical protein